jgi:hypothetical protein
MATYLLNMESNSNLFREEEEEEDGVGEGVLIDRYFGSRHNY